MQTPRKSSDATWFVLPEVLRHRILSEVLRPRPEDVGPSELHPTHWEAQAGEGSADGEANETPEAHSA